MAGQFLVEEGVIAFQKVEDAAILAKDISEEHLGFLPHGFAQRAIQFDGGFGEEGTALVALSQAVGPLIVGLACRAGVGHLVRKLGEKLLPSPDQFLLFPGVARQHHPGIDVDAIHVAGLEPLAGEILDQRICAFVGQHSLRLKAEILSQLTALGEAEELIVGHGGPNEIGEPRSQGIFIDEWVRFGAALRERVLDAEEEAGRSKHGDHGLGHAIRETFARFSTDPVSDGHQAVQTLVVGGPAPGPQGESAQHLPGVLMAFGGVGWDILPEEEVKALGPDPMLFVKRALHAHGRDAEVESVGLLFDGRERVQRQRQPMRPGLPFLIELEAELLVAVPSEFLPGLLLVVDGEHGLAAARIKIELAGHLQFQD